METPDIKSIVKQLKKEYWDWQLSKPDPIPKPKRKRLPLVYNRASYRDVERKYPVHAGWKVLLNLKHITQKEVHVMPPLCGFVQMLRGSLNRLGPKRKR